MKQRYDKEDDALMIWFSKEPVDHAEQTHDVIVHLSRNNKPVLLEILNASRFLQESYSVLPPSVRSYISA